MDTKKSSKIDHDQVIVILRKFSVKIAGYLNLLGFYPNQITLIRVFLFWVGASILFYVEDYVLNLLWLWFLFLYFFFDLVDWDLARNHNKKSDLWRFLDENLDLIVLNVIIFSLTLKMLSHGYSNLYVIWGMLALLGWIVGLRLWLYLQYCLNINCVEWNPLIEQYLSDKKLDFFSKFFYWLIVPRSLFDHFFSSFRYFLLIGVFTWFIHVALLIYGVASILRGLLLFVFISLYCRDNQDNKLIIFSLIQRTLKDK